MFFLRYSFILFILLVSTHLWADDNSSYKSLTSAKNSYKNRNNEVSMDCTSIMRSLSNTSSAFTSLHGELILDQIQENYTKVFQLVDKLYEGVVTQRKNINYEDVDILTYIYWTIYYQLSIGSSKMFDYFFKDPAEARFFLKKPYNAVKDNVIFKVGEHFKTDIEKFREHFEWGHNLLQGNLGGYRYWIYDIEDKLKKLLLKIKNFSDGIDDTNIENFSDVVVTAIKLKNDFPYSNSGLEFLHKHILWLRGGTPLESLQNEDFINDYNFYTIITTKKIRQTIEKFVNDIDSIDMSLSLDLIGLYIRSFEEIIIKLFETMDNFSEDQLMVVLKKLIEQDEESSSNDIRRRYYTYYFLENFDLQKKLQESKNGFIFWLYLYYNLVDREEVFNFADSNHNLNNDSQKTLVPELKFYNSQLNSIRDSFDDNNKLLFDVVSSLDDVDKFKEEYVKLSIKDKKKLIWFLSQLHGRYSSEIKISTMILEDLLSLKENKNTKEVSDFSNIVFNSILIRNFMNSILDYEELDSVSQKEQIDNIRNLLINHELLSDLDTMDRLIAIINLFFQHRIINYKTIHDMLTKVWNGQLTDKEKLDHFHLPSKKKAYLQKIQDSTKYYLQRLINKGIIVKEYQIDHSPSSSVYRLSDTFFHEYEKTKLVTKSISDELQIKINEDFIKFIGTRLVGKTGLIVTSKKTQRQILILCYLMKTKEAPTSPVIQDYLNSLATEKSKTVGLATVSDAILVLKKINWVMETSNTNHRRYMLTQEFKQLLQEYIQNISK